MKSIKITHNNGVLKGRINLPASKSISNRLLILNHLPGFRIHISNISKADDTGLLARLLSEASQRRDNVHRLNAGNAGTVFRFLAAWLSLRDGEYILDGDGRMRQRPLKPLVQALRKLGAGITWLNQEGYPPIRIKGGHLSGDEITVDGSVSSQFVSALMLIAPALPGGLRIHISGQMVSRTYVEMTGSLMRSLGIDVDLSGDSVRVGEATGLVATEDVESDWSSAAFFYEMAMLASSSDILMDGLSWPSFQGDAIISQWEDVTGVETHFEGRDIRIVSPTGARFGEPLELDFRHFPDLSLPLIVALAGRTVSAVIRGIDHLSYKESDRISALKTELRKIGVHLEKFEDGWKLSPSHGQIPARVEFHPHGDHRVAMSLAGLALKGVEVILEDPGVVTKSYPGFWDQLEALGFIIE